MSTIGIKLNLAKLTHVLMTKKGKEKQDVKCIVIPINENNLFEGKEGNVYLDLIAFKLNEPKHGKTHLVKQSLPKDVREKMSKEEQNATPILGDLTDDITQSDTPNNAAGPGVVIDENDSLPF